MLMNNGSFGTRVNLYVCMGVCVSLEGCQGMDTKDVEWLGVWHSIT